VSRRSAFLIAAGLLVVVLVGGRWLALETSERAWAATVSGGAVLNDVRHLARLVRGLVLLFSIVWATANVFIVYRAIGSVQMPHRLGDLEIVEAVPQRVLFGLTLTTGIVGGIILSWRAGDWWRMALLATAPPHFGVTDPFLGRDLGFYVGVLPWQSTLQSQAMAMTAGAAAVTALLYAGMGSLRVQQGRLHTSDHARSHLALLLACLALVVAWGAVLDPAELVAGLHGEVDEAQLAARLPAGPFVAAVAVATAVASLAWGWRDRPNLVIGGWAALLLAVAACYLVVPGIVRASRTGDGRSLAQQRAALERRAFGLTPLEEGAPPAVSWADGAAPGLPLWDVGRVARVAGAPPSAVTLWPGRSGNPAWLIAPITVPGAPRVAIETETGLALRTVAADTAVWFGPGKDFTEFTVASPAAWPALRRSGIPLIGAWRRAALAWALQGPELARLETDGLVLLWRRDVVDRLERLVPFATFGAPTPALDDAALWWVSWGYVASEAFPLVRSLPWRDRPARYMRAGLVGAVRAATGETHVWLAPGHDSLAAAWARRFVPLVEPPQRIPAALLGTLPYPPEQFQLAAAQLIRTRAGEDSAVWILRPDRPFQVLTPELWTGIALEAGTPVGFVGLLAGAMTPQGPQLRLWRPGAPERLPAELVGSSETAPGELRIWRARERGGAGRGGRGGGGGGGGGGSDLLTAQAQFADVSGSEAAPRLTHVYLSLGDRTGAGPTGAAARRALVTGGGQPAPLDTSLAGRWERARHLAAQADSALAAGDVEGFGRLYRELMRLLAPTRRPR
jgi:hypothetical protein